METPQAKRTVRAEVTGYMREILEDRDHFNLAEITDEVADKLVEEPMIALEGVRDLIRPMVYQYAAQVMSSTRQGPTAKELIPLGDDEMTTREAHRRRSIRQFGNRFSRWIEHAGDVNGYVRYLQMNREELLSAASAREKRGTTELIRSTFNKRIANALEEGQVVADVYGPQELEDIYTTIERQWRTAFDDKQEEVL